MNNPPTLPTVNWQPVTAGLPDSDTTVLIHLPKGDEPVWMGFHDGEDWRDVSAVRLRGRYAVSHWAHLPDGPKGGAK